MLIDLTCPAEIFRTGLPTEEIPAATLTLFNLSDRVISSVEVTLRLLDAAGGETERLAFRGRALNGRPHSTFLLTAPCAPSGELKSIDATVEKVWFADKDVWRRNPANAVEYTPNDLPVSPALTNLKYAAGETAVGFPNMQNGLWVCVCGRPNPEGEPCCARCGRRMEDVFSLFSPEAVKNQVSMKQRQLDLTSRSMREDTIRMQRLREEEYRRKKARRGTRIRTVIALAAAFAMTAGALLWVSPWLRLTAARRALDSGDAAGAKATLEALGSFGNAQELIGECDWILAKEAADSGTDLPSLTRASAMLRALADRPEAAALADEKDLLRAGLLLEKGRWQEAREVLEALPEDYDGRAERLRDCRMAEASGLMENRRYVEAREIFLELGDYPGAREQALECVYRPAVALMELKEWDSAIERFSTILDYRDSRNRARECHYHKGEELEAAGDLYGASDEFLMAGDWSDAPERSRHLTYLEAEALYNAGDLRAAQTMYASIPDYEDANDKDRDCRYRLAAAAADDREYTLALELLAGVPDDYRDTADLRIEATYQKAKTAVRQEDWSTAAELLGGLNRAALRRKYRDIEDLYRQACLGAGINPDEETPVPESTPEPEPEPTPAAPAEDPFLVTED